MLCLWYSSVEQSLGISNLSIHFRLNFLLPFLYQCLDLTSQSSTILCVYSQHYFLSLRLLIFFSKTIILLSKFCIRFSVVCDYSAEIIEFLLQINFEVPKYAPYHILLLYTLLHFEINRQFFLLVLLSLNICFMALMFQQKTTR